MTFTPLADPVTHTIRRRKVDIVRASIEHAGQTYDGYFWLVPMSQPQGPFPTEAAALAHAQRCVGKVGS